MRRSLFAVAVATFPMPVCAQTSVAPDPGTAIPADNADAQPQSVAGRPARAETDDIVVTAQRRSERLQDVPLTIVSQNAAQLTAAGVTDTRDLQLVTPGLKIDRLGVYTQPSIRGISSQQADPGNDPNVALYVDGVYQPSQAANTFDFADLDHIEVAKGPQGTLFGRNATGGAIQIFTRQPEYTLTGDATIGYGSYKDVLAKGFLTGPIVKDVLAASVSFYHENNEGYNKDVLRGGYTGALNSTLARAKILFEPAAGISFTLGGQYLHRKDGTAGEGVALGGNTIGVLLDPSLILPKHPYEVALDSRPFLDVESYSGSLRSAFDLGLGTLTSITAYQKTDVSLLLDGDYSAYPLLTYVISQPNKTFSQELSFASGKRGSLSWIAGLFYYNDDARWFPNRIESFEIYGIQKTEAYAAFGELNYDLSDRLTAIAGVRYSRERKTLLGAFGTTGQPQPPTPKIGSRSWDSVTPRVSLRYRVDDATNIYATYSQGFKSGGFVVSTLTNQPFDPEKVNALEVGVKTKAGGLAINAAGFYYLYSNMQVNVSTKVNGVDVGITQNAAKADIYGIDLDATARISPDVTAAFGLSWLHATYSNYEGAIVQRPSGLGGNVETTTDASGNHLVRAPGLTATMALTYRHDFDLGRLDMSGNAYYSSRFYFDSDNRLSQARYASLGARIAFSPKGTPFELALWGKNLTNQAVIQSTFILATADGAAYAPPRTIGGTIGVKF